MKLLVHRLFLILIMLWLPVQGTLSAGVPLCLHEENAGSEWNPDVILTINDHLITIHHEQPMDSSMISNQECEANALCQASFSTVITSAFSAAIPSDSFSYAISLITKPISFIPEQPQRPPLA
ncbi:hypothetical protein [Nitrosomonas ureae]|uniref:Uncharacterized protein n=1 Tax=Nitrosomonas ureae TaxID=44577 RepID=A0A286ALS0_9PROT|nr:hypothetical protein [Nitrosomonas ureae]SOD22842.1 hypothetical protein SAMN06297164_3607 [Nitrosomonas ureae]